MKESAEKRAKSEKTKLISIYNGKSYNLIDKPLTPFFSGLP
jgi:hypothetical protein